MRRPEGIDPQEWEELDRAAEIEAHKRTQGAYRRHPAPWGIDPLDPWQDPSAKHRM